MHLWLLRPLRTMPLSDGNGDGDAAWGGYTYCDYAG